MPNPNIKSIILPFQMYISRRIASLQRLSRTSNCQSIGSNISRVTIVALDPSKRRLNTSSVSFLDQFPNLNHQILIRNRLTSRCLPIVFLPIDIPGRGTVYSIAAVSDDLEWSMERRNFQSSLDTSQLGPLVSLIAFKTLRDIATNQLVDGVVMKHMKRHTADH
jgi:hypothetical protein